MIYYTCPYCRESIQADPSLSGKSAECAKCHLRSTVPASQGGLVSANQDLPDESIPVTTEPPSIRVKVTFPKPADAYLPAPADYEPVLAKSRSMPLLVALLGALAVLGLPIAFVVIRGMSAAKEKERANAAFAKVRESVSRPVPDPVPVPIAPTFPRTSVLPAPAPKAPSVPVIEVPRGDQVVDLASPPLTPKPSPRVEQPAPLPARKKLAIPVVDEPAIANVDTEIEVLKRGKAKEKIEVCQELAKMGPRAKGASRALCGLLLDANQSVRLKASEALEAVNPVVQKLALDVLIDTDAAVRGKAATQLENMGEEGKPAIPVLIHVLDRGISDGGEIAIRALAAIGADDKTVASRMGYWLTNYGDGDVRLAAVRAVPQLEHARECIVPLTVSVRGERSEVIRAAAAEALGEVGKGNKTAERALAAAKTDRAEAVRQAADQAMRKIKGAE